MARRGRDIDAAIPVVKALLAGEEVTEPYFGLVRARVGLRSSGPYEWWIGGTADVAIDRAARLGDVWYGSPGQDDDSIARSVDRYRSAGGQRVAMRRDAVVLGDARAAQAEAERLVNAGYRGMPYERLLVGSPEQVTQRCRILRDLGCDDVVVRCASDDQTVAVQTLTELGQVGDQARQ